MIKSVVHDEARLVQRSQPATPADGQTITDLIDTLRANQENCVGMAANMIGVNRRIIVVDMGILPVAMIRDYQNGWALRYTRGLSFFVR